MEKTVVQVVPQNFYDNVMFDFVAKYYSVIMVAFGVSAFCFNLGASYVFDRKFMKWVGIGIVIFVIGFLLINNRKFLLEKNENTIEI